MSPAYTDRHHSDDPPLSPIEQQVRVLRLAVVEFDQRLAALEETLRRIAELERQQP